MYTLQPLSSISPFSVSLLPYLPLHAFFPVPSLMYVCYTVCSISIFPILSCSFLFVFPILLHYFLFPPPGLRISQSIVPHLLIYLCSVSPPLFCVFSLPFYSIAFLPPPPILNSAYIGSCMDSLLAHRLPGAPCFASLGIFLVFPSLRQIVTSFFSIFLFNSISVGVRTNPSIPFPAILSSFLSICSSFHIAYLSSTWLCSPYSFCWPSSFLPARLSFHILFHKFLFFLFIIWPRLFLPSLMAWIRLFLTCCFLYVRHRSWTVGRW